MSESNCFSAPQERGTSLIRMPSFMAAYSLSIRRDVGSRARPPREGEPLAGEVGVGLVDVLSLVGHGGVATALGVLERRDEPGEELELALVRPEDVVDDGHV